MSYKLIGKHFSVFFFLLVSFRFQDITNAKNVGETKGFFCFSFNKEFLRKPLGNATFFAYVISAKKKEKCFPKNQFVAYMPKIRQNLSKN